MKTVPALGTSFSRPLGSVTTRLAQTLSAFIPGTSPAVSERSVRPVALQLARGEVHRVNQRHGVCKIQVIDGILWLTTTPAEGDILLRASDGFVLPATGPVIFEALKAASVLLVSDNT